MRSTFIALALSVLAVVVFSAPAGTNNRQPGSGPPRDNSTVRNDTRPDGQNGMSPNAGPPRDNSTRGNDTRPTRPDIRTGVPPQADQRVGRSVDRVQKANSSRPDNRLVAPASAGQGARPSRGDANNGNGNPPNATSDHTDVPRNPVSKYPGSVTLTPPRAGGIGGDSNNDNKTRAGERGPPRG